MKSATQELKDVRQTLIEFWTLLNNDENVGIYQIAAMHGVKLSEDYVTKITPLNRKLKKFMGIK